MVLPVAVRSGLGLMQSNRSNASGPDLFGGLGVVGEFDMREFDRELREMRGPRARRVQADALNFLSAELKDEATGVMLRTFHRPTRWTMNSVFVWKARAREGDRMFAGVYFKDQALKGNPAGRYLYPTITGSARPHKGFEKALIRAGILAQDEYATPSRDARLDHYGNIPGGMIKQMLSQLKAGAADQWETEASRKRTKKGRLAGRRWFFADGEGGLARGIYYRTGRKRPVMVFHFHKGAPQYRTMYPFRQIMAKRAAMDTAKAWRMAWQNNMIKPRKALPPMSHG